MHLCNIPEDRINAVEIPTGLPLIYDRNLGRIRLLQEIGADGTLSTGEMLLEKYNFGDSPDLLFDLSQIDVPFIKAEEFNLAVENCIKSDKVEEIPWKNKTESMFKWV